MRHKQRTYEWAAWNAKASGFQSGMASMNKAQETQRTEMRSGMAYNLHLSTRNNDWVVLNNRLLLINILEWSSACHRGKNLILHRYCVSSLRRDHANLLCIVPILANSQKRTNVPILANSQKRTNIYTGDRWRLIWGIRSGFKISPVGFKNHHLKMCQNSIKYDGLQKYPLSASNISLSASKISPR